MDRSFAVALAAAAAVVLSAPFAQQAFGAIDERWPAYSETIVVGATVVPVGLALLMALWRIRENRWRRYLRLALGLGGGVAYIRTTQLFFTETFHFIEYGVLAALFYRAWLPLADRSTFVLPLLACAIVGSMDEWFQWFIPIRAGEARNAWINIIAAVCGLLFAVGFHPPGRAGAGLQPAARARIVKWATASTLAFALFFQTVHVGHDVGDPDIGSFRPRYTGADLAALARDRADHWRTRPPLAQRRLSREDQYLTEGLWHVQRRNEAWSAGDVAEAWRENRVLETFYAPILDAPTYAGPSGQRWSAEQRADAAERPGVDRRPSVRDAYPYPLYVWPGGL